MIERDRSREKGSGGLRLNKLARMASMKILSMNVIMMKNDEIIIMLNNNNDSKVQTKSIEIGRAHV